MPVVEDELWKNPGNPGMIVVSSHASIESDGRLYMGYRPAVEATKRIPDIEYQCGAQVAACAVDGVYGFLPIRPSQPEKRIVGFGLFQTQINWDESPDPGLIKYSMECLRQFAEDHSSLKIRMNFPGVGNGGLAVEEVAPILIPLPPTVTVCHQGEIQRSFPTSFPGFKSIYLQVEGLVQEGRANQAVEYLLANGFDIQSAMEQVNAVGRCQRERVEKEAEHVRNWRGSKVVASR
jgi:hypothetical protein